MENIFITALNMSITASYFVIALIVFRAIFRKVPKWILCILWGLSGLRLILPFSFESILSLIPSKETIPVEIIYQQEPHITSGIPALNYSINPIISDTFAPAPGDSVNPLQILTAVFSFIWIAGIIVMLSYMLISFILLSKQTKESLKTSDEVYLCDLIPSPFILGIIKPKIFLPSDISDEEIGIIISHEKAHIRRGDHIWKPLAFILLAFYWFNPVIWAAYIFLCRDIEAACDERVLNEHGHDIRKLYSETLLAFSAPKKLINVCPLAFGETGVKTRIKNILHYKKPTTWLIITAVITSLVLTICFISDPKSKRIDDIDAYSYIFKDVEKIQLFIGSDYVYTTEDPSDELRQIKKIILEKTPVQESRDNNRSKTYRIEINDSVSINIDDSFQILWLDDNIRPSYSYKIKNPDILRNLFTIENYTQSTLTSFTDLTGVYITINQINRNHDSTVFDVTWHNENNIQITYGEIFSVEKFNNGTWTEIPLPENFVFLLPAYILDPFSEQNKTYTFPKNLTEAGTYRISTDFSSENSNKYYTKATFTIDENSKISIVEEQNGTTAQTSAKKLTLEEVVSLSEKGNKLSWKDFEEYDYIETGSGLYIRLYEIDERFSLTIGGLNNDTEPMYIYLNAPDNGNESHLIDIRSDNVEEFINEHKDDPIIQNISFSQRGFPVDNTGDNYGLFIKYGCYIPRVADRTLYLPTIKIESNEELNSFTDFFDGTFKFFSSFQGEGLTFSELCEQYEDINESFFENHVLFITYAVAQNENNFFEIGYANLYDNILTIAINERKSTEYNEKNPTGWIIVSEISKDQLTEITHVDVFITPELSEYDFPFTEYRFSDSKIETMKPNFKLYDNGIFIFEFHPLSSYIGTGHYEKIGNTLRLITDEGYCYVFNEKNGSYVFDAENSSEKLWMSDIKDGSIFRN